MMGWGGVGGGGRVKRGENGQEGFAGLALYFICCGQQKPTRVITPSPAVARFQSSVVFVVTSAKTLAVPNDCSQRGGTTLLSSP